MQDNWQHRSSNMICETCMFFVPKADNLELGRCRRHAPSANGFVPIFTTDWCGDHRLDGAKIIPRETARQSTAGQVAGREG